MKLIYNLALIFLTFDPIWAGLNKPHLTVNVRDGTSSGLEVLDPTLSWSSTATALDCNFEMGCDVSIRPTLDVLSLPQNIWGKVSKNVLGWGLSSRVNVEAQKSFKAKVDFSAKNTGLDTSIKLNSSGGTVQALDVAKGFNVEGGRFVVNPKYNFKESKSDLILDYDQGSTSVTFEGSMASQKITVSQEIAKGHRIIPTFTADGDISLGYEMKTANGSISTNIKPNDSINVQWRDGPWIAVVEAPLDGLTTNGVSVNIKRKVELL